MPSINSYSNSNLTLQNPNFRRYNGYNNTSYSSSKTRKLAIGATSLILPGLGQVINGETSKGIAFFLGLVCNALLFFKNHNNMLLGKIGSIGIRGLAAYDAYKKA